MRGHVDPECPLFSDVTPDERVSSDQWLRLIRSRADTVLKQIRAHRVRIFSQSGRPSSRRSDHHPSATDVEAKLLRISRLCSTMAKESLEDRDDDS
jgi:hypothetical protein